MNTSNTFQNLSDEKVQEIYDYYKALKYSDDEIFEKIYNYDCLLDKINIKEKEN